MPWSPPVAPVSGTVITVPWAVSSVVNPLNWLRQLTGGADPGQANRVIVSLSATTTAWGQIPDEAIANPKVAKSGDTMTGDLQVNRSGVGGPATAGYLILGNNSAYYLGYDGSRHVLSTPSIDVTGDIRVYRQATPTTGVVILGTNPANYIGFNGTDVVISGSKAWHATNDGAGSGLDADLLDGHDGTFYATAAALAAVAAVPSGLIAAFASAAAIAAGWTRFTNGNGRMLVGAGTFGGQTFVEGASAGSTWVHNHGVTITSNATTPLGGPVQGGGSSSADPSGHTHVVNGSTADVAWIPPSYTVVWAQKT